MVAVYTVCVLMLLLCLSGTCMWERGNLKLIVIVLLLVILQNNKKWTVHVLKKLGFIICHFHGIMVMTSSGMTWEGHVLHMGGTGNAHTIFGVGRKNEKTTWKALSKSNIINKFLMEETVIGFIWFGI